MKLNYNQVEGLYQTLTTLKNSKMSFKLGLIIAKNLALIEPERQFYFEKEREFVTTYLVFDEETGGLKEQAPGVYQIKEGMQDECHEARKALDSFEIELDLRKIPLSLIEDMEFTPEQIGALECLIDEEG